MLLLTTIDAFKNFLEAQRSCKWKDAEELASASYKSARVAEADGSEVKTTPGWVGAIVDGVPCLFREIEFASYRGDVLKDINRQAHIARSYLQPYQVVDLTVFIFLVGLEADEHDRETAKAKLQDDPNIARKCVELFESEMKEKDQESSFQHLANRSPFSAIFRPESATEGDQEEKQYVNWPAQLRREIDQLDISVEQKEALFNIIREEAVAVLDAREAEAAERWPERLAKVIG